MPALLAGLAPHAKNIWVMADTGLVLYKNANWYGADGDDHDTPPGTAHLQHLRDLVAAGVVSCIFDEPQGANHQIDIVTGASTVRRATLDAIGVGRPAEPDLFFDMMRANYSAFAACLAGMP